MKWTPDKLTALILVISCVALIATGRDSEVKSILTVAAGYLFGTGVAEMRANHRSQLQKGGE
jgi:hypothetical protein